MVKESIILLLMNTKVCMYVCMFILGMERHGKCDSTVGESYYHYSIAMHSKFVRFRVGEEILKKKNREKILPLCIVQVEMQRTVDYSLCL